MNDKEKAINMLRRTVSQQLRDQERFHGEDVDFLDFASWGDEQGILLTPREAKLILTLLTHPTSDKN